MKILFALALFASAAPAMALDRCELQATMNYNDMMMNRKMVRVISGSFHQTVFRAQTADSLEQFLREVSGSKCSVNWNEANQAIRYLGGTALNASEVEFLNGRQ